MAARRESETVSRVEIREYLETVLWLLNDESDESGGKPMDANYTVDDFSPEARQRAVRDLEAFRFEMDRVLRALGDDAELVTDARWPHHFWLNRNGYGVGFWDNEDEYGPATEAFAALAERAGNVDAYVGDDDQVHFG